VVVAHESWPYFARRFGLTVAAALEPTPGVPPSAAYLAHPHRPHEGGRGARHHRRAVHQRVAGGPGGRARRGPPRWTLIPSVGGDPEARDYLALFDVDVARLVTVLAATPAAPVSR